MNAFTPLGNPYSSLIDWVQLYGFSLQNCVCFAADSVDHCIFKPISVRYQCFFTYLSSWATVILIGKLLHFALVFARSVYICSRVNTTELIPSKTICCSTYRATWMCYCICSCKAAQSFCLFNLLLCFLVVAKDSDKRQNCHHGPQM